jgi:hypothetical protein
MLTDTQPSRFSALQPDPHSQVRPTGGLNLLVKKVKRAGHGFRSFANCRLRILLHADGVAWGATRTSTPRIRGRAPHFNAQSHIRPVSPGEQRRPQLRVRAARARETAAS